MNEELSKSEKLRSIQAQIHRMQIDIGNYEVYCRTEATQEDDWIAFAARKLNWAWENLMQAKTHLTDAIHEEEEREVSHA